MIERRGKLASTFNSKQQERRQTGSEAASGGASFFEWGGQRGEDILGGQVYMVANLLPQYGTHTPLFQVSSLSLDLSFLFASYDSFPFHLSFIPISRPFPSFDTARRLRKRCKLPQRSGRNPAAKWNWVNSGPKSERFLTCQSGKLQCSLNSLIHVFDSVTVSTVLVSSQMRKFTNVSK